MEKYESGPAIASYSLLRSLLHALIAQGTFSKEEAIEIMNASRMSVKVEFGFSPHVNEDILRFADQLLEKLGLSLYS